ncbi:HPP family protein [Aestuariivirga sp.]|uniref:HPP family protein n=1 Tax=Aestuariivirga sp. TaxID=2650926 RepID=UPI00391BDC4E
MQRTLVERLRELTPRMAGTSLRERSIACLGALIGIGIAGLVSGWVVGGSEQLPLLVAPMGASAVLLFAVPASPLAQPWSIIGGNTVSALVGIAIAHLVPDKALAAALAVALAIGVMSALRCLHPPGGAASLLSVLGGPAAASWQFSFALVPVALNSVLLVLLGVLFHRFSRHSYPHRPKLVMASTHGTSDLPPQLRVELTAADIDAALAESGEPFDIAREDLHRLVRRAEFAALERTAEVPRCSDIMSRDVLSSRADAPWSEAHALLLAHDLRILPVVDAENRVAGIVEMHEPDHTLQYVSEMMSDAVTALPGDSMLILVDPLSDGRHHAVLITDGAGRLLGLVTQTDMIVALARLAVSGAARPHRCGEGVARRAPDEGRSD